MSSSMTAGSHAQNFEWNIEISHFRFKLIGVTVRWADICSDICIETKMPAQLISPSYFLFCNLNARFNQSNVFFGLIPYYFDGQKFYSSCGVQLSLSATYTQCYHYVLSTEHGRLERAICHCCSMFFTWGSTCFFFRSICIIFFLNIIQHHQVIHRKSVCDLS